MIKKIGRIAFSTAVFFVFALAAFESDAGAKNRLAGADSPYLLKHADNPVDWYEWGPEALDRAKQEDKLIFLSIGYTACHWCNELEREVFEHQDFADIVNERYIAIKVDRERRPDLDKIYLEAAIALQGHGGWPNNVFLTPELAPVFAVGFQRRDTFKKLVTALDDYWKQNRDKVRLEGRKINAALRKHLESGAGSAENIELDLAKIRKEMDRVYGGFGEQNKFPLAPIFEFLITEGDDAEFMRGTLDHMAGGGLFDHVGGGFHRYATDVKWEIPHFEKMLYDNALLAGLFARAAVVYGDPDYEYASRRTLAFIERELMNADGGFLSSLDADSEGREGAYYLWSLEEVKKIAGDPAFVRDYGVTAGGNMFDIVVTESGAAKKPTGQSVLRRLSENRHDKALAKLFIERHKRQRPALDDKVVASWHALAVSAFAKAGVWFDNPEFLARARVGADFIEQKLGYRHMWRGGRASGEANLDDVSFAAVAFWDLFEATGEEKYLAAARRYADHAIKHFSAGDGSYYLVKARDDLIARPRVDSDNPLPSSAAALARVNRRLGVALDEPWRVKAARKTAANILGSMEGASLFTGEAMSLLRETTATQVEVVYAFAPGEKNRAAWLRGGATSQWGVVRIPLGASIIAPALAEGRFPSERTMAYVCLENVCLAPSMTPEQIGARLDEIRNGPLSSRRPDQRGKALAQNPRLPAIAR